MKIRFQNENSRSKSKDKNIDKLMLKDKQINLNNLIIIYKT
jgi:hypothetical protein